LAAALAAGTKVQAQKCFYQGIKSYVGPLPRAFPTNGTTAPQAMTSREDTNGLADFQALIAGNRAAIYRVAYRLTGNHEDAQDLVQEGLIEAFQAFDRFRIGTHFDRWVSQIMTHTYIDKFRRRRRLSAIPLDAIAQQGEEGSLADSSADPQQMLDRAAFSDTLQGALDRLSPEFRAAVVLCDVNGLSYEEASRVLRCPVGTVRSRLHRARSQLQVWLRPLLRDDER